MLCYTLFNTSLTFLTLYHELIYSLYTHKLLHDGNHHLCRLNLESIFWKAIYFIKWYFNQPYDKNILIQYIKETLTAFYLGHG